MNKKYARLLFCLGCFYLTGPIAQGATRNVSINTLWHRGDNKQMIPWFFQTTQEACDYNSTRVSTPLKAIYYGGCYYEYPTGNWNWWTSTGPYNVRLCSEDGLTSSGKTTYCVGESATDVTPGPPNNPLNLGPSCDKCTPPVGKPINPTTGNMWHIERDYLPAVQTSGLQLTRTYNSTPYNWDASVVRSFGVRWTQPYDALLKAEKAFTPGVSPGTCWRGTVTQIVTCDGPAAPAASAIPAAVSILRGDGKKYLFNLSGTSWVGDANANDRVSAVYNADNTAVLSWVYVSAQGDVTERYNANGQLTSITARNGTTQLLTYSNGASNDSSAGRIPADAPICTHVQDGTILPAGRVTCVTDQAGRQLNFEYDATGRITTAFDPAGQVYQYEYDGVSGGCTAAAPTSAACTANNLTKVTYPDGNSRTYYYNEVAQINSGTVCTGTTPIGTGLAHLPNAWTGLVDENGTRHISWTYDCYGRATSSEVGAGVEKVVLDYSDAAATTITHVAGTADKPLSTVTSYGVTSVLGVAKNASMSQRCPECGDVAARTFDANGNLATAKDWNGVYTCYSYDLTRNLETARIEGASASCLSLLSGTSLSAPVRRISTQWHATFRLPLAIAEPKKRTTYGYDASGNLLSVTEQATSDETGALGFTAALVGTARTRTVSYDALGQPLTVKGPRTAVDDTVKYVYDSQENLISVTDAAQHTTTLSNYDANGRPGRITAPNGTVTDLTYKARGWLASRSVTAGGITETTSYDYDGVGQLIGVTLPDASRIAYTYDEAHRLTGIADSLGNSIVYTLDLTGNRIKEQVSDPTGVLARQTARVFDALNQLQQQTGAAQ
jgi:YD repeat-containing protein